METTYIKHHGIKGQKWGSRNGPPYPIAAGKHSAAEKRAGSATKKKVKYGGASQLTPEQERMNKEATDRGVVSNYTKKVTGDSHMSNNRKAADMTTAELQAYNTRRQAEDQYKDFQRKDYQKYQEQQAKGLKTAKEIVNVTKDQTNMIEKSVKDYYDTRHKRQKAAMDLSNMSDDELRRRINRMDMERRYRELTPAEISKGERFWTNTLRYSNTALNTATTALDMAIKIKSLWDD